MKILLISCVLLLCSSNSQAITLGGIKTIIRQKLKDSGPTSGEYYWNETRLNSFANIIQRDICFRSDAMRRYFYINASTDTRTYVLNANVQKIYAVHFEDIGSTGTYKKLDYISRKALDKDYLNWENFSSGEPLEWYQEFISTWSTSEIRIGLQPPPSSTYSSTGTYYYKIRIDASEQPADMTSDSETPFNGNTRMYPMHIAIVYGVLALARDDATSQAKYDRLIEILGANFREMPSRGAVGGIKPRR